MSRTVIALISLCLAVAALSAVGALLAAALAEGASRVSLQVSETEPGAM